METGASASVDLVNLLLEYTTARGMSTDALIKAAGIDRALLAEREARIQFEQYQKLWHTAVEQSRDPDFGLHFGEAARDFPAGHLLGAVMMNSPTVGEALRRFSRYHGLMSDAVAPRLESSEEHHCISVQQRTPALRLDRHYNEANLCVILTFARKLCRQPMRLREVRFTHARPADTKEHNRIFDCPTRFGQQANQMLLDGQMLDWPLRHADPDLLVMVEQMAGERLERSTTAPGWEQRAERSILRTLLEGGKPAIEVVALDLAVGVRHLQLQLKDEGTTYQQVLDRVRRELALDYLERQDLTLCEIAFLLGYSDQSAFNHAFKRWTGQSPKDYRGR